MAVSGLPQILRAPELVAKFDSAALALSRATCDQWRRQFNSGDLQGARRVSVTPLFGDLAAPTYMDRVKSLAEWLSQVDSLPVGQVEPSVRRIASRMVWQRLYSWEQLDSLLPEEVLEFAETNGDRAFLRR